MLHVVCKNILSSPIRRSVVHYVLVKNDVGFPVESFAYAFSHLWLSKQPNLCKYLICVSGES